MILTQACIFVFPAVVFGFITAFPVIYLLYSTLFSSSLGYMPSIVPSGNSVAIALFVGLFIPFMSSIIPVKQALSTNLTDALNVNRSKNQGVMISIVDNQTKDTLPYLLFGSVSVIFGIAVYYGLPIAMLSLNLGLIL